MLASCIGLAVLAALYEGYKVGRELLYDKTQAGVKPTTRPSHIYPMHDKTMTNGLQANGNAPALPIYLVPDEPQDNV